MGKGLSNREKEILEKVTGLLKKRLKPKRIILFGSRAKGSFQMQDDFDFAVDGKKPKENTERQILREIEQIAGLYQVDIVYLSSVDKEFKEIVTETGKVIYEKRN